MPIDTKQAKDRLTGMQEAFLATMFLFEDRQRLYTKNPEIVLSFRPRFFREMLGVNWQGYHADLMQELQDLGWIKVIKTSPRSIWYQLTQNARSAFGKYEQLAKWYVGRY